MQSKNCNKIKRDIGRHILNRLNFNIKRWQTSRQPMLPSFVKRTEKKCQWQLERCLYSMDVHTHTSYTQREIFNHALEGKNSSKGLNFKKKWRKNTKSTHRKDQGSMPGQTWIFPGLFFNRLGCLFNCENHLFPLSVHITLFNVFWYNIIHFIRASFLNRSTIKTGFP